MIIRTLQQQELLPALHLVWEVFVKEVAPLYTPEGVGEFQNFIKYENICELHQKGEITFFGAYEGAELCGVMAVKRMGHICLFYVKGTQQGKGIGRMLFEEVKKFCFLSQRVNKITVNAAPGAVVKYEKLGFQAVSDEKQENGIRFIPLEMPLSAKDISQPADAKKPWVIAAIAAGVVLFCVLLAGGAVLVVKGVKTYTHRYDTEQFDEYDDFSDGFGNGLWNQQEDNVTEPEEGGIDAIGVYEEDGLTYKISDEEYKFEDTEAKNTTIQFEVRYPQITGLDKAIEETVNKALKDCAMETVDKIYTNPSDEIKEGVLKAQNPALVSYVRYRVTYLSKDFISVVFEDSSYQGSAEEGAMDLRTMNISLKDGAVYEVKDIVKLSDEFIKQLRTGLQDEADNNSFLSELSDEDMKKTMGGDTLNGVYVPNFFVDEDGIEIGYDFNYTSQDQNDLGYVWVTAPFELDGIQAYKTDSKMWSEIK